MLKQTAWVFAFATLAMPAQADWFMTSRYSGQGAEQVIGTIEDSDAVYVFCRAGKIQVAYVRTDLPDIYKNELPSPQGLVQIDGKDPVLTTADESFSDGSLTARFLLLPEALKDLSNAKEKVRVALLSEGKVVQEKEFSAGFAAERARSLHDKCGKP